MSARPTRLRRRLDLARDVAGAALQCSRRIAGHWGSGLVVFAAGLTALLLQISPEEPEQVDVAVNLESPPHTVLVGGSLSAWYLAPLDDLPPEGFEEYEDLEGGGAAGGQSGAGAAGAGDEPLGRAHPASGDRAAIHTVRKGQSLWQIAEHYYGSGKEWVRIRDANPALKRDPSRMRAGMALKVPLAAESPGESAKERAPAKPGAGARAREKVHVVRRGDDLYTIARTYRPHQGWRWLYDANRGKISDPKRLRVGTKLTIPPRNGDLLP
ncbi:MAG: LysM peptidoglycan-binding domain-containing protein [Planctomycetes bacterium]|nr:LysM peptidoglycan-binding domain-containing protein [Planctomycetota bacterium]